MINKLINHIRNPKDIVYSLGSRGVLNFINDKDYIKWYYRVRIGNKLDLKKPKTFNEKLQWLKLYDRNPKYTQLVDKYNVRRFVKDKLGENYLIPLIGVWESFEEINFNDLPDEYVLKTNHDSSGVIINNVDKT